MPPSPALFLLRWPTQAEMPPPHFFLLTNLNLVKYIEVKFGITMEYGNENDVLFEFALG